MDVRLRNLLAQMVDLAFLGLITLWICFIYWVISHDVLESGDAREGVPILSPVDDVRWAEALQGRAGGVADDRARAAGP